MGLHSEQGFNIWTSLKAMTWSNASIEPIWMPETCREHIEVNLFDLALSFRHILFQAMRWVSHDDR